MFYFIISLSFIAFPSKNDALLYNSDNKTKDNLLIESSGSIGLYHGGKCHQTYPNYTVFSNQRNDWCSNIIHENKEKPWISYHFTDKAMKLTGYSIRNGCCHYICCCIEETGQIIDEDCCCRLFSFSLLGSNDNITWKTIHKVEKDYSFGYCQNKHFDFEQTQAFNFIRLVMDEPRPGCIKCMQINQVELYGSFVNGDYFDHSDEYEESVSIIGKIKKE